MISWRFMSLAMNWFLTRATLRCNRGPECVDARRGQTLECSVLLDRSAASTLSRRYPIGGGIAHAAYTRKRERIKHVTIDSTVTPTVDGAWPKLSCSVE